jgi:hypothetical protein
VDATDILAGPILRRVERDLVSVWIALSVPATVDVEVFRGQGDRGSLGSPVARKAPAAETDTHTIRVGEHLHVVVSIWEPDSATGLNAGEIYSYDLVITPIGDSAARLGDLGLLADHADPPVWLALGYQPGWLPSFATVPNDVADLRLIQGSCRGSTELGRDAFPPVDDLLGSVLTDPAQRPHLMFLTGDQIYADESAAEQLDLLQTVSRYLLGGQETITVDFPKTDQEPAETVAYPLTHFPPGRRGHPLNDIAGFTSTSTDSHMMGVGEYAALYLSAWSTTTWNSATTSGATEAWVWDPAAALIARKEAFTDYVRAIGQAYAKLNTFATTHSDDDRKWVDAMIPYHDGWRLVPRKFRAIDTTLTDADRDAIWGKLGKDGDNERFQLWSDFWQLNPDDPATPHGDEVAGDLAADTVTAAQRNRLARVLTPSWFAGVKYFGIAHHPTENMVDSLTVEVAARSDDVITKLHQVQWYLDGVPRVRRLLANIPSFMIFDDHEVTDDWNITPRWAKQTRANALGRAVIRNALAACTVFQSWGNDPRAYRPGSVGRTVLERIGELFPGPATAAGVGPAADPAVQLERLFDLRQLTAGGPRMLWHFRYDGPGFEVIALDTRTWRGFEPEANETIRERFSDEATATLLTDEALRMQITEQPAIGVNPDGVCFVIAAAPFIGYPIVESIVQPLINLHDIAKAGKPDPPFVRWQRSFSVGRVARDPENWGFVPSLFEAVLARLSTRRRVVFLSGDVHYGFTMQMGYWVLDPGWVPRTATRVVQLTASSFRAQRDDLAPLVAIDLAQQIGVATSAQTRLGWHRGVTGSTTAPPPLVAGADSFTPHLQSLLTEDPIVVSYEGIPATARFVREPEWAWSTAAVADQRSDEDRFSQVDPPPPFSPGTEADLVRSVGERHFWASQLAMPRNWQWWTNFTTIGFTRRATDGKLDTLQHRIYGFDPQDTNPLMHAYIVADVPLDVVEAPPAPPTPDQP